MGWTQREDSPRKLNAQNRKEWRLLFEEFKTTELFKRSPSLTIFVVFQDWVAESYDSPSKRTICK
jgi:hypothetical protein